ncbi:hypothetical protein FJZ18_02075 [Candidatus Pacearchaeota archaeon]|nr:hypothetical protein [Candidatus Pacearchaeota archaeon]
MCRCWAVVAYLLGEQASARICRFDSCHRRNCRNRSARRALLRGNPCLRAGIPAIGVTAGIEVLAELCSAATLAYAQVFLPSA